MFVNTYLVCQLYKFNETFFTFKSCKNTVKVKWENRPCSTFHTIEYVIPGVWLAVWRDRRGLDFDYFDDKNTILAIMAEIFYATHMNAPLR